MSDFHLNEFLPYLLNQASETTGPTFADLYKSKHGLLRTEWKVLAHLGELGPLSARDICALSKTHKTKISRAVFALETKRLLQRAQNANDRRFETLSLTKMGKTKYDAICRDAMAHNKNLRDQIGAEAFNDLIAILQKIARIKANA